MRVAEIEHLKLWISKLRSMQFGRKSGKLDHQSEQLGLQLEDLRADDAEAERKMRTSIARRDSGGRASRCPNICHVMKKCICRRRQIAQPVAGT